MKKKCFAEGLSLNKLIWIFTIGSIFGCLYETVLYFFHTGKWILQKGLLFGPFNQIYGFGAVLFLVTIYFLQSGSLIFLLGALFGGIFEFLSSWIQEIFFHTISWDYSNHFLNFQGRTSLPVMLGWGLLAYLFVKVIAPFLDHGIEKIPLVIGNLLTWIIVLFFLFDFSFSMVVFHRMEERQQNLAPHDELDLLIDQIYPNSTLTKIFPNKKAL